MKDTDQKLEFPNHWMISYDAEEPRYDVVTPEGEVVDTHPSYPLAYVHMKARSRGEPPPVIKNDVVDSLEPEEPPAEEE